VIHIPCATEKEVMDFCAIQRVRSLIEISGKGTMTFIPSDAARMGLLLVELAEKAGWRNPEADDGK
jgi:hypothetical protein